MQKITANRSGIRITGNNKIDPIFIVGAPRSGTSLLRVILNRHPSIGLCDETYFFYYVYTRRDAFGDLSNPANRRHLIDRYLATRRIQRLDSDLQALTEGLMKEGGSYRSFFITLMRLYAAARGKVRYGEKTPQHALFAETLCEWYPKGKLIHLVRDPRDVVGSLLRMPWASNHAAANARIWSDCVQNAERCRQRDNYILVRYEDLVSDPHAELMRVCAFIGEEYCSAILVSDNQTPADMWWFQKAQEPLSGNEVGKWRQQLTGKQVALIEWVAGSYMRQFGYEPSGQTISLGGRSTEACAEFFESVFQKITRSPRLWYHWMQRTQLAKEEAWIDI